MIFLRNLLSTLIPSVFFSEGGDRTPFIYLLRRKEEGKRTYGRGKERGSVLFFRRKEGVLKDTPPLRGGHEKRRVEKRRERDRFTFFSIAFPSSQGGRKGKQRGKEGRAVPPLFPPLLFFCDRGEKEEVEEGRKKVEGGSSEREGGKKRGVTHHLFTFDAITHLSARERGKEGKVIPFQN